MNGYTVWYAPTRVREAHRGSGFMRVRDARGAEHRTRHHGDGLTYATYGAPVREARHLPPDSGYTGNFPGWLRMSAVR